MQQSIILGIESSCDDTAAAIVQNGKILANIVSSQKIHEIHGGVIPELASRAHQSQIVPVVNAALNKADLTMDMIHAVAVTQGPGLMGSLLVGLNYAKGLAIANNVPIIGVNHLQAHVSALFIENQVEFPLLVLLVSGGHTQIAYLQSATDIEIIGKTLDDAAGEAIDKGAKMLGLPYPGGPAIDKISKSGDPQKYIFNEGKVPDFNFSFSGIKTSLLYFLQKAKQENPLFIETELANVCASYQHCIMAYLLKKVEAAVISYKPKSMGLAGGVSANSLLRTQFSNLAKKTGLNCLIPSFEYCTDNAAMIAFAGYMLLRNGHASNINIEAYSR